MIITDVFLIERLQVINEGTEGKTMKVRGVFQRAEESNSNGRIYPQNVLSKQLDKLQPLIEGRRLCGELDHPTNDTVKLSNASHLITKLEMKGNEVIGEAEILNTPAGLTARALINGGVKIGISSRGMGTLSESSDGKKIVNEDFNLITFDLVADPSTRGAYPELSESKRSKFINESKAKLQKESNLLKLIKRKLDEAYNQYNDVRVDERLTAKQSKYLDYDKDGSLESSDFASLRASKRLKKFRKGKSQSKLKKKLKEAYQIDPERVDELVAGLGQTIGNIAGRVQSAPSRFMKSFKKSYEAGLKGKKPTSPKVDPAAPKPEGGFFRKTLGGLMGGAMKGFNSGYSGKPVFDKEDEEESKEKV